MFAIIVLFIISAGAACTIYLWRDSRREWREYGKSMHVRFDGHVILDRPKSPSGGGSGVTDGRDDDRDWQYENAGPTALDLLYEQMEEQRWREGCRRREREREQGY
jgi:hypothetical protein